MPLAPKHFLCALLSDPADVARLLKRVKQMHPPFPEHGATPFLSLALWYAGLPAQFDPVPSRMALRLQRSGWRRRPATEAPQAGDLFAAYGTGPQRGYVTGLGIVAKVPAHGVSGWFLAADERLATTGRPYRRPVAGDADCGPVAYWLTYG